MFTGIIKNIGLVVSSTKEGDGRRIVINIPKLENIQLGDSVSISGCCLTVVEIQGYNFTFYISAETLKQTTLAMLQKGQNVNIEPAMLASTPLGGHIVLGHVDEVARVIQVGSTENTHKLYIEISSSGKKNIVKKGSITVDGISLTIMNIKAKVIELNIIPHTWQNTTLALLNDAMNNLVNIEYDHMVKIINKKIDEHFANH